MRKIKKMRQAFNQIHPNMSVLEFVQLIGYPDSCVGNINDGILTWSDSVWKGIFRGGTIFRKVIVFTRNGVIVQYNSENLNVSDW